MPEPSQTSRKLVLVPIVHAEEDLGSLGGRVREHYVRVSGADGWRRRVQTVDGLWQKTRAAILGLRLDYSTVRLYQDGLAECGFEERIVRELAETGSPNYRLLVELMDQGARITGTESSEALLEEYALARQAVAHLPGRPRYRAAPQSEVSRRLLERRDQFIAAQINRTLGTDETGIIFLGRAHSLAGRLPPDIELACLDPLAEIVSTAGGLKDGGTTGDVAQRTHHR